MSAFILVKAVLCAIAEVASVADSCPKLGRILFKIGRENKTKAAAKEFTFFVKKGNIVCATVPKPCFNLSIKSLNACAN